MDVDVTVDVAVAVAVAVALTVVVAVGFIGFGATIHTLQEISGLRYVQFLLNQPTGPIQSLRCDIRVLSVCVSVPSRKTRFPEDWKLLVKEGITNIDIHLDNRSQHATHGTRHMTHDTQHMTRNT